MTVWTCELLLKYIQIVRLFHFCCFHTGVNATSGHSIYRSTITIANLSCWGRWVIGPLMSTAILSHGPFGKGNFSLEGDGPPLNVLLVCVQGTQFFIASLRGWSIFGHQNCDWMRVLVFWMPWWHSWANLINNNIIKYPTRGRGRANAYPRIISTGGNFGEHAAHISQRTTFLKK